MELHNHRVKGQCFAVLFVLQLNHLKFLVEHNITRFLLISSEEVWSVLKSLQINLELLYINVVRFSCLPLKSCDIVH